MRVAGEYSGFYFHILQFVDNQIYPLLQRLSQFSNSFEPLKMYHGESGEFFELKKTDGYVLPLRPGGPRGDGQIVNRV